MSQPQKFSFRDHWFLILLLLIGLAIAGYTVNFYATHEKVADTPDVIITPEARANRFFVSEKLLEKQQKTVHHTKGETGYLDLKKVWQQSENDAKKQAVLIYHISKNQEPDIDNIIKWIEKGGHLITFSQDVLEKNPSDNDIKRYEFNENLLLVKLGIVNRYFSRYYGDYDRPDDKKFEENHKFSDVSLNNKILFKLPMQGKGDTFAMLAIENEGQLDTQEFFKKNLQAKAIADYQFVYGFDPENPFETDNIRFANVINPLTEPQYAQIKQAIYEAPHYFMPTNDVMLDVQFGQGRLTVFNDKKIFNNPSSYRLENIYYGYCDQKQPDPICKQAEQMDKKQLDIPKFPVKNSWELLKESIGYSDTNVGSLDNALMLQYLLTDRTEVWFASDVKVAGLMTLLWKHLKWACVAFLLLLGMAMLALPKRFGQPRPYKTDSETNIFGYFDQVGQYLWQSDKAVALVQQNRERLLEKIVARHPLLSQTMPIEPIAVCQTVAKAMNISSENVAQALYDEWQNETEFLQMSQQFAIINRHY